MDQQTLFAALALIGRWDNAPDHPPLSTFPHHRREGETVHESPRVSIEEVLTEMETRFREWGNLPQEKRRTSTGYRISSIRIVFT